MEFKKTSNSFYLMEFKSVITENRENRKLIWLPFEKALGKLFYTSQRKIVNQVKV